MTGVGKGSGFSIRDLRVPIGQAATKGRFAGLCLAGYPAQSSIAKRQSKTSLFDPYRKRAELIQLISELTGRPPETVDARLSRELKHLGANVTEAFARFAETPEGRKPLGTSSGGGERFVFDGVMAAFYESTDAFLYELAVWNRNKLKRGMSKWAVAWVSQHLGPSRVLCFGDGLGCDSVRLAEWQHDATYFDLPGLGARFAERVFEERGFLQAGVPGQGTITHVTDEAELEPERHDAVFCFDVLEHVPDPAALVQQLAGYLRPGGALIVHAPFYMVHPSYPTHLKANRRFSGDLSLFEAAGLRLVDGRGMWNPLVFQAIGAENAISESPTPGGRAKAGLGWAKCWQPYMKLGRFAAWPFVGMRWIKPWYQLGFE